MESKNLYMLHTKAIGCECVTLITMDPEALDIETLHALAAKVKTSRRSLDLWHCQPGHISHEAIRKLSAKGMVNRMGLDKSRPNDSICIPCMKGKQT